MAATSTARYADIVCCMCGTKMQPNGVNMCDKCMHDQYDITEGIALSTEIVQCQRCEKWHIKNDRWMAFELESPQLLGVCLKRVKGLHNVKIREANWIWTEPHSKRLKIKVVMSKEVIRGSVLFGSIILEFVVKNRQCDSCANEFTNAGGWQAVVQVRQKRTLSGTRVGNASTFLLSLEQQIINANAHKDCLDISPVKQGLDFYFPDRVKACRFISYLQSICPLKLKESKKLIGSDNHSNTYRFKHSFKVDIVPLCRYDLVLVPRGANTAKYRWSNNNSASEEENKLNEQKKAKYLKNGTKDKSTATDGCLALVTKITSTIHLLHPVTLQTCEVNSEKYSKCPVIPLFSSRQLTEFLVLDVESFENFENHQQLSSSDKKQIVPGEVTVVQFRSNQDDNTKGLLQETYRVPTHIAHLLSPGDIVLGFDVKHAPFVIEDETIKSELRSDPPDVIIVRKVFVKKTNDMQIQIRSFHQRENDDLNKLSKLSEPKSKKNYRRQKTTSSKKKMNLNEIDDDGEMFNHHISSIVCDEEEWTSFLNEMKSDFELQEIEDEVDQINDELNIGINEVTDDDDQDSEGSGGSVHKDDDHDNDGEEGSN